MSTISELKVHSKNIRVRRAAERGHAQYDWLDTWHTFSFNTYYDPVQMGFRSLRVINEDWVQPGKGFGMAATRLPPALERRNAGICSRVGGLASTRKGPHANR
jgi:hypothetical protein